MKCILAISTTILLLSSCVSSKEIINSNNTTDSSATTTEEINTTTTETVDTTVVIDGNNLVTQFNLDSLLETRFIHLTEGDLDITIVFDPRTNTVKAIATVRKKTIPIRRVKHTVKKENRKIQYKSRTRIHLKRVDKQTSGLPIGVYVIGAFCALIILLVPGLLILRRFRLI